MELTPEDRANIMIGLIPIAAALLNVIIYIIG